MRIAAIGGDNPTPFFLKFPTLPLGAQWVFPYTYGFMFNVETPGQLVVDASQVYPGFPTPPTSTATAVINAYDQPQMPNPGRVAGGASPAASSTELPYISPKATYTASWHSVSRAYAGGGAELPICELGYQSTPGIAALPDMQIRRISIAIESVTTGTTLQLRATRATGDNGGANALDLIAHDTTDTVIPTPFSTYIRSFSAPNSGFTVVAGGFAYGSFNLGSTVSSTDPTKLSLLALWQWQSGPDIKPIRIRNVYNTVAPQGSVFEGLMVLIASTVASTVITTGSVEFTLG